MECRECESVLAAYAVGDLSEEIEAACRAHLDSCEHCREVLAGYRAVMNAVVNEPGLVPTASESAALARALSRAPACRPHIQTSVKPAHDLIVFALASVVVFVILTGVFALQAFGYINLFSVPSLRSLAMLFIAGVAIIVVTSFVPIAVTARRRPLNGLTFRR